MQAWAGEVPDAATARQALRRALPVLRDMRRRAVSEAQPASGGAGAGSTRPAGAAAGDTRGGDAGAAAGFQPRWPLECHFSAEYLDDLLAQVQAALRPQDGGSSGADGPQHAAAAPAAGEQSRLLTPHAHALYAAAASGEERAALAAEADRLLQSGALAEQAAGVVRSHWLLRLQLEWEVLADERAGKDVLQRWEQRRAQRRWVGRARSLWEAQAVPAVPATTL